MRTFLLLAALLLTATPAFAGGGSPADRVHKIMGIVDTDHDGRISRQEAQQKPRLAQRFDKVDTDKDGYISPAELQTAIEKHLKR